MDKAASLLWIQEVDRALAESNSTMSFSFALALSTATTVLPLPPLPPPSLLPTRFRGERDALLRTISWLRLKPTATGGGAPKEDEARDRYKHAKKTKQDQNAPLNRYIL